MFMIKYNATERHRFASEETKAGAFAYDAKRDRAGWALAEFVKKFSH